IENETVSIKAELLGRIEKRRIEKALPEDQRQRGENHQRRDRDDSGTRNAEGTDGHNDCRGNDEPLHARARDYSAHVESIYAMPRVCFGSLDLLATQSRLPLLEEFKPLGLIEPYQQLVVDGDRLYCAAKLLA